MDVFQDPLPSVFGPIGIFVYLVLLELLYLAVKLIMTIFVCQKKKRHTPRNPQRNVHARVFQPGSVQHMACCDCIFGSACFCKFCYEERSLYYPFERFVQNYARVDAVKAEAEKRPVRYSGLRPIYAMNILGYRLFGEDDDALRIFELYDPKRGKKFKELLKIGFFELGKANIETANQKHWRDYFVGGTASECAPEYIKKASKIIEYVNMSEEERKVISAMERMEANDEAERYYIATENRAKGMAEGEMVKAVSVARNLLSINLSAEQIAAATGLAAEEIEKMRTAGGNWAT